ncbi:hypothetical protein G9A89_011470 [Geosiphon pyriformis]|nr:hypothetical protein G9A89_011470 [Geosiphon pyriformis]
MIHLILQAIRLTGIRDIVAIGHGSGAVYATLQVLELISPPLGVRAQIEIVTFGQPRIGNREFAEYVNRLYLRNIRAYRFVNMDDYVSRLPSNTGKATYIHHILEYWIKKDSCDCSTAEVFTCLGTTVEFNRRGFIQESEKCNNKFTSKNFLPHNGTYLGVMMGRCIDSRPPWEE